MISITALIITITSMFISIFVTLYTFERLGLITWNKEVETKIVQKIKSKFKTFTTKNKQEVK